VHRVGLSEAIAETKAFLGTDAPSLAPARSNP